MKARAWGNAYRNTTLCIDSYDRGVPIGTISSPYLEETIRFESLTQFLLHMEDLLNEMNFPQASTATRTFVTAPGQIRNKSSTEPQRGKLATFHLKVLFRQHTSWQGTVTWSEGETEEGFRSVLELIFLMDSALRSSAEENTA